MDNRYGKLLAELTESTAAAQSADLLPANFAQARPDTRIRLTIVVTAAIVVSIIGGGGSDTLHLNNGTALVADAIHTEEFTLDTTRTWNIQTGNVAGMTCTLLSIVEVDA